MSHFWKSVLIAAIWVIDSFPDSFSIRHFLATDFTFKSRFSSTLSPTRKTTFCGTTFCEATFRLFSVFINSPSFKVERKLVELFLVKHLVDILRVNDVFVDDADVVDDDAVFIDDNDAFETSINRLFVSSGFKSLERNCRLLMATHRRK